MKCLGLFTSVFIAGEHLYLYSLFKQENNERDITCIKYLDFKRKNDTNETFYHILGEIIHEQIVNLL